MMPLQPYHHAWLGAHPERDEVWLRTRLKDGFDVHHLDGNHTNNDPLNLVLIDGADHLMLHNGSKRVSRVVNFEKPLRTYTELNLSGDRQMSIALMREAKREAKARKRELN